MVDEGITGYTVDEKEGLAGVIQKCLLLDRDGVVRLARQ